MSDLEERLARLQEAMAIHASGELLGGETQERVAMWNGYADTCRDAIEEITRLKMTPPVVTTKYDGENWSIVIEPESTHDS